MHENQGEAEEMIVSEDFWRRIDQSKSRIKRLPLLDVSDSVDVAERFWRNQCRRFPMLRQILSRIVIWTEEERYENIQRAKREYEKKDRKLFESLKLLFSRERATRLYGYCKKEGRKA